MKKALPLLLFALVFLGLKSKAQHFPFPQHTKYYVHIKPSQYTQDEIDRQVEDFYDKWKKRFLKNGCEKDQYYVWFDSGNTMTVSEAMGYGMLIVPLMAGYDPDAQNYFDGLFRFFKAHPSHIMPHLMAWKQVTGCKDADGPDSATDGDVDIAFGLLLAYAQWGNAGDIDYLKEALLVIKDLMGNTPSEGDINQDYFSVKLGDWVQSGHYMRGTRTSDFIIDHFRIFAEASKDTSWYNVVDECYNLIDSMQVNYSPKTGLLPDFIVDVDKSPQPAPPHYLESKLDGNYSYNACRDPWRLANDYLINGDKRARKALLKIDRWLLQSTGGSVNKVYAGYYLNGAKAVGWSDLAFTAPFTVGAMVDTAQQEWLNKLYSRMLLSNISNGGYYDNTLKLLSMITLSGNYWVPPRDILSGTRELKSKYDIHFKLYPTVTTGKVNAKIGLPPSGDRLSLLVYDVLGNLLINKQVSGEGISTFHLNDYPAGIYLVALVDQKGELLGKKKIIKQK